jgi:hypothetical protein
MSQYKFDWSQKPVTVQDLYGEQVRASGYKIQQYLSEDQGSAKTVTSLLTLSSMLGAAFIFLMIIWSQAHCHSYEHSTRIAKSHSQIFLICTSLFQSV